MSRSYPALLKELFLKTTVLSIFLSPGMMAAIYYPYDVANPSASPGNLQTAIVAANSTAEDDIIDLSGHIYSFSAAYLGGNNALPIIASTGGKLTIVNGTIQRSFAAGTPSFRLIENDGDLSLYNITIENGQNETVGGGVFNHANNTLKVTNSTITGNESGNGGAIYSEAIANIINSAITKNSSDSNGGGIYNSGGTLNIKDSTIAENIAAIDVGGGGIYNANNSTTNITNSAITGNETTSNDGGGLYNENNATMNIINSTIAENLAGGNLGGGGILNLGTLNINNSTIATNATPNDGSGGGIISFGGTINLFSTIVVGNTAASNQDISIQNTVLSEGYNLFSSIPNFVYSTTDIIQLNALSFLGSFSTPGALQDNGGSTFTIALLPGSLAINNGVNPLALSFDQREKPYHRVCGGVIDIGAYEIENCSAVGLGK